MHFILAFLGLATLTLSTPAHARTPECTDLDKAHWMSPGSLQERLAVRGFRVVGIDVADTCYKAQLEDGAGRRIEGYYDPISGQPIRRQVLSY